MPRRIRTKAKARTDSQPVEEVTPVPSDSDALEHTDEFLDEVDSVLETNELEILRSFVQRGGQ